MRIIHTNRKDTRATLLFSLLALSPSAVTATPNPIHVQHPLQPLEPARSPPPSSGELSFTLKHVLHHGTFKHPTLFRTLNVKPQDNFWVASDGAVPEPIPVLKAKSRPQPITRLVDRRLEVLEEFLFLQRNGWAQSYTADAWTTDEISHPNITDKETVITLAKMTADAYVQVPAGEDWMDIGPNWNSTNDFGWDGDGLRGHIFVDERNKTIIVSLKGTSPAVFDGPETTTNDKINDNLLFSCCCGRVSRWWKTVCDCYSGTAYTCGKTCLKNALMDESRYYRAALNLYAETKKLYPRQEIWLVGHSLGGSVSSLLGMTVGLPVVTFEAPGEALAANRLGLPTPPGGKYASEFRGAYHFGVSADPIYMGACTGPTSVCSIGGYAMETSCHSGRECLYDVVNDRGWRMGPGYHRIQSVIKDVLETYDTVPECKANPECVDCYSWTFTDSNGTNSTTTTTTAKTKPTSSSTTCISKGWWGCLDDGTTSTTTGLTTTLPITITTTTPTITTTSTTVTCTSYGWFGGCLDGITSTITTTTAPTTTTTTTTTTKSTTSTTVTCTKYGWFGNCLDGQPTTTTTEIAPTIQPSYISVTPTTEPTTTTKDKCKHRGWYGRCLDPTGDEPEGTSSATVTATSSQPTVTPTKKPKKGNPDDGCDWWEFWC